MERGTEKAAEHGLGVGVPIGRHTRVRPLLRFEAEQPHYSHSERSRGISVLLNIAIHREIATSLRSWQ